MTHDANKEGCLSNYFYVLRLRSSNLIYYSTIDIQIFDNYIREVNPYSKAYKQMHEVVEEQEMRHLEEGIPLKNISMFFKRHSSNDPRRYNIPKIGVIAVIFDGENEEPHMEDFLIQSKVRNNEFITTKLSFLSHNADPMVYPLIFFNGEPGWRPGIEDTTIKPYDYLNYSFSNVFKLIVRKRPYLKLNRRIQLY